jgi:M18 family aminopeptidase
MPKDAEKLSKELLFSYKHVAKEDKKEFKKSDEFSTAYKEFLNKAKTERECVALAKEMLIKAGYKEFDITKKYKAGDKVYKINRGKAIMAATFGSKDLNEGIRINAAHIDSPRLDLKPNPLYEKNELAFFKTHYYGGIRKYQWVTIPLAMHGVVVKKDGTKVEINIGEAQDDPVFMISDLLPHLGMKQGERKLAEGINGEELNIIVASLPLDDADIKDAVKLHAMKLLNDRYGITERDFARAEIEFVPALKARDMGFDRSLIAAYGQDDRICAYPALIAEIETKKPEYTTLTVLADKEEIGSVGNTGLHSNFVYDFISMLATNKKADVRVVCENSACLSSDVNAAYDPTFDSVFEANNSCYLNHGCVLTKYTGARGKYSSSDASAEFMAKVIDIMDKAGVHWQIGELGAVDVGGGGTVAQFIAMLNIDVVDLGIPVLAMHAPCEVASKIDLYNAYKAFKAFYA